MTKKLASLLLAALLLAVPLRTLAGFAMPCAMGGHAAMQAQVEHEMADGHCHDALPGAEDPKAPSSACDLCPECCLGSISLPVDLRFAFTDRPGGSPLFPPSSIYIDFIPEGPERPPRYSVL